MTARIFFTADTHFGHANIIGMCNRPFATVEEMDAELIARWNAHVGPEDHVYHLGDFAWMKGARLSAILSALNGTKTLIRGNHDHRDTRKRPEWHEVRDYQEITLDGHRLILFHYPIMEWAGAWRGSIHLYGHVHGLIPVNSRRCDVGVDCWDFRPVGLHDILARLADAPAYDPRSNYGET